LTSLRTELQCATYVSSKKHSVKFGTNRVILYIRR